MFTYLLTDVRASLHAVSMETIMTPYDHNNGVVGACEITCARDVNLRNASWRWKKIRIWSCFHTKMAEIKG